MNYMQALPTFLTVLALAYMGFLVSRNSPDKPNRLFLLFILTDSLWLISVFFVNFTSWGSNVVLGRFVFSMSILLIMTIHMFTNALLQLRHSKAYMAFIYAYGLGLFLTILGTPFIIKGVRISPDASGNLSPFPLYGTLFPFFLIYVFLGIFILLLMLIRLGYRLGHKKDATKRQLNIVTLGLVSFSITGVLTNLVLPEIFSAPWPSQFAPVGSLFLALSFFYAIRRYRLFDIRTAVVRSTTYLFFTAALTLVYVGSLNLTSSFVTTFRGSNTMQRAFNIAIVLVIAVSFQPLKRLFDKMTNRYFFRDLYETQEVIDDLNSILIGSSDLDKMIHDCNKLLADKLKLEYCMLIVFAHKKGQKDLGLNTTIFDSKSYKVLLGELSTYHPKVISRRNLPNISRELQRIFEKKDVGALAKLATSNEKLGLIIFGDKKNGKELSTQDLGVLSIAADQAAIATQNALRFEEIQNFNVTLQKKVDDATQQLRKTNERLKVLDQTKDDFISMASHQLRTPLTSVKGYLSMVLEGDVGKISDKQSKLLGQAFISSQRMVYLIADLLNVSRLRTGKFVLEPMAINLAEAIESEVGQLKETAAARGLKLTYDKPKNFPVLMLDETKIRQVIMNFVDNAIYYTPPGGRIQVSLTETAQSITFSVTDSGIGVPKSEQHHLFTKFFRAHNAKKARPDGTGLGLFMAQKVVIAQGGSILFKSQEGKGSTFGFTFAKAKLRRK